jgi:hypothetical protein
MVASAIPERYVEWAATCRRHRETAGFRSRRTPSVTRRSVWRGPLLALVIAMAVLPVGCGGSGSKPAASSKYNNVMIMVRNHTGQALVLRVHAYAQVPAAAFEVPAVRPATDGRGYSVFTDIPGGSGMHFDPSIVYAVLYVDCSALEAGILIEEDFSSGTSIDIAANGTVTSTGGGLIDDTGVTRTTNCLKQ